MPKPISTKASSGSAATGKSNGKGAVNPPVSGVAGAKAAKKGAGTTGAKPSAKPDPKAPANMTTLFPREIIYPDVKAQIFTPEKPLTVDRAKALLGWTETAGDTYHWVDEAGKRIWFANNSINRPIKPGSVSRYKQEIMRDRWKLNGETIIVGETGQILDGQHTLIALVQAAQELSKDDPKAPAPYLTKIVVFGIGEDDDTVNTINTGEARTLSDVLFRSEYFADLKPADRRKAARIASYAIKLLWDRTGAATSSVIGFRTHSESVDFIDRHPTVLKAVRHILDETDGEGSKLGKYLSPGYAAGLLYLMATSATPSSGINAYREAEQPVENYLDFSNWDKACDFFVNLSHQSPKLGLFRQAFGEMLNWSDGGSLAERMALIVKAWVATLKGKLTKESLELKYHTDDEGIKSLKECPTTGGIDVGRASDAEVDPSEDEIAETKEVIRQGGVAAAKSGIKRGKKAGAEWATGDTAWVKDDANGEHWFGTVVATYTTEPDNAVMVTLRHEKEGREYDEPVENLLLARPKV